MTDQQDTESLYTEPTSPLWPITRAQPRSFFRAPLCDNLDELDADVSFIGVPFDQGTLGGRPGARLRPRRHKGLAAQGPTPTTDPFGRQREAEGFFDVDAAGRATAGASLWPTAAT